MSRTSVVITGHGLITAYGPTPLSFLNGLLVAQGPGPKSTQSAPGVHLISSDEVTIPQADWLSAVVQDALFQGGWKEETTPTLIITAQASDSKDDREFPSTLIAPTYLAVSGYEWTQRIVVSHACASVLFAVELARRLLRTGAHRAILVAGVTKCDDLMLGSLRAVHAIGSWPSRPFDSRRDGIILGEGAGALLLESSESANARGATALTVLSGSANLVSGRSAAASDPRVIEQCIAQTIGKSGGILPSYIHAHATGTIQGDQAEAEAIRSQIGAGVPISSHKGAIGHLLHASGFPSIAIAIATLAGYPPPRTVGLENHHCTPELEILDAFSNQRNLGKRIEQVLVNSFGFGGNNGSLMLTTPN